MMWMMFISKKTSIKKKYFFYEFNNSQHDQIILFSLHSLMIQMDRRLFKIPDIQAQLRRNAQYLALWSIESGH